MYSCILAYLIPEPFPLDIEDSLDDRELVGRVSWDVSGLNVEEVPKVSDHLLPQGL